MSLAKEGKPKEDKPSEGTRETVLYRDDYRCVRCGISILNHIYSIHHRRMRSHPFAELHQPANLLTLCGSGTTGCHGWVHDHPKEAMENGWLVSGYTQPESVPVIYAWPTRHKFTLDNSGYRFLE